MTEFRVSYRVPFSQCEAMLREKDPTGNFPYAPAAIFTLSAMCECADEESAKEGALKCFEREGYPPVNDTLAVERWDAVA